MSLAEKKYRANSIADLHAISKDITGRLKASAVIELSGDLGAGKTTLIQHLGHELGVKALINSPTFNLLNQYKGTLNGESIEIFHLDLYRLGPHDDLLDLDFSDLCRFSAYLAFIEWPEKAKIPWREMGINLYRLKLRTLWPENTIANLEHDQPAREIIFSTEVENDG